MASACWRANDSPEKVILHARDHSRADAARAALPECEAVVVGDVSTLAETKAVAAQGNELGPMNAVIHNVGTGYNDRKRFETEDGLSRIFAVNVVAPYVLTALLKQPERLIFHQLGHAPRGGCRSVRRPMGKETMEREPSIF